MQVAFKMKLHPGYLDEYRKRHNELWPEMRELLKARGICDYSIFYDAETGILFAVQKIDVEFQNKGFNEGDILQKWWDQMADIMDVNPDNSPVIKKLEPVFHLR